MAKETMWSLIENVDDQALIQYSKHIEWVESTHASWNYLPHFPCVSFDCHKFGSWRSETEADDQFPESSFKELPNDNKDDMVISVAVEVHISPLCFQNHQHK